MSKKILLIGLISAALITVIFLVRKTYNLSPEYNYITAKLDIKNGNCRIVRVGEHTIQSNSQVTKAIYSKYGFRNVYIEKAGSDEINGINNYNRVIETYLAFRNRTYWKADYQKEIDSILVKTTSPANK